MIYHSTEQHDEITEYLNSMSSDYPRPDPGQPLDVYLEQSFDWYLNRFDYTPDDDIYGAPDDDFVLAPSCPVSGVGYPF